MPQRTQYNILQHSRQSEENSLHVHTTEKKTKTTTTTTVQSLCTTNTRNREKYNNSNGKKVGDAIEEKKKKRLLELGFDLFLFLHFIRSVVRVYNSRDKQLLLPLVISGLS